MSFYEPRIHVSSYRYLPLSREVYEVTSRPLYRSPILTRIRASSVPPMDYRESSPVRDIVRALSPVRERSLSPPPSSTIPTYTYHLPLHNRSSYYPYRPYYSDLYRPSSLYNPLRDPYWYDPYAIRPYYSVYPRYPIYPSAVRSSFLSPVKNRYLWSRHPLRPL